jgi:ABC-type oligopeptide transport system substrate-binding subunit
MKKIISVFLIIILLSNIEGCKSRKLISKTRSTIDSTRIVSVKHEVAIKEKDSSWNVFFGNYLTRNASSDLTIDKIEKKVEIEDEVEFSFQLNVDELKTNGDTITTTDITTGTKAKLYRDAKTGDLRFDLKKKGGKKQTFEMTGFSLKTKDIIDSGITKSDAGTIKVLSKDSSAEINESTSLKASAKTIQRDVKKDFGLLKWIGIIVLLAGVLRLMIYFFRNKYEWIGKLNKFLGGK